MTARHLLNTKAKPTIEIRRAAEADWVPRIPGLDVAGLWGYRVIMPHGNSLTGVVRGPRENAVIEAERFIYKSTMSPESLTIRNHGRRYTRPLAAQPSGDDSENDGEDEFDAEADSQVADEPSPHQAI